jgi:succinate dehydrogenase flavin-adding protein (antitoxin of CptAB toxin-antitoxin module)
MKMKDVPGLCTLVFVVSLIMGYCIAQRNSCKTEDYHHIQDSLEYSWVYCPDTHIIAIFNKEGEIITHYYKQESMPKVLRQDIKFPTRDEVLHASDEKVIRWFDKFSNPSTEEETMVMKLIIQRKNRIKNGNTANQR